MTVLGMFLSGERWTLAFEASPEEQAEALRVLGPSYKVALNSAIRIFKEPDGTFRAHSGGTFQGALVGKTLEELARAGQERIWFRRP
jgi:hypothetical protein